VLPEAPSCTNALLTFGDWVIQHQEDALEDHDGEVREAAAWVLRRLV